jgi:hypothetical protein
VGHPRFCLIDRTLKYSYLIPPEKTGGIVVGGKCSSASLQAALLSFGWHWYRECMPIDPIEAATVGYGVVKAVKRWWTSQRPVRKVLSGVADNDRLTRIFVRDFVIPAGTPLISKDRSGVGMVPNVLDLWPRVEGVTLANILNVMGQVEKTRNIEIIEMSKDPGLWDSDLIVLGAQAQKCFDFYKQMQNVAYTMDAVDIRDMNGRIVRRDNGYGYGIILKCRNPHVDAGVGFLIGGFGTLGTEAAGCYFLKHCVDLGKRFSNKYFGVVVRASVTAGVGSVERIESLDIAL